MLKKYLIGTAVVALFAFAMTVSAVDFGSTTLKVGSKGEAVKAVQTLVGATADGSFGPMTKAKVMVWQAANGLTADGSFGKLSMAKANAGSTTPTTPVATGCQAGWAFNPATGASCTGTPTTPTTPVVTGTTDGSITASTSSYVSSTVTAKKGETKDVVATRLQASVGPVKVTRVDVTFNARPWLLFGTVALHDNTGKVLATKTLTGLSDTTELTVGTSYQVRFDGLDYTVTPGTNPDLAVSVSVLPASDKITGQTVTVAIPSMRTISEVGYTDTITTAATNGVTLTITGSVAALYTRISPSSPVAGQQVVSATQTTNGITLGAFSIKTTNTTATLNSVAFGVSIPTQFTNYRLFVAGSDVGGASLATGTITFSNLTIPLALDVWTDLTVKADAVMGATGTAHITLVSDTANIVITDANYGTATITAGTRTSNDLVLTANSVAISGTSATLGSAIVQSNNTVGYNATYAFTLTNNSNNDLYVSSTAGTFVTTTKTSGTANLTSITVSPATVNGDATLVYAIPSGTARTFTMPAAIYGASGSAVTFKATSINYNTDSALGGGTAASISTGLSALSLTASF